MLHVPVFLAENRAWITVCAWFTGPQLRESAASAEFFIRVKLFFLTWGGIDRRICRTNGRKADIEWMFRMDMDDTRQGSEWMEVAAVNGCAEATKRCGLRSRDKMGCDAVSRAHGKSADWVPRGMMGRAA